MLADPTLLVQESESSSVGVGTTVFTNISSSTTSTGQTSCEPVKETAGLQVDVSVERIDDNGFVTMKVNPTLKTPSGDSIATQCGSIPLTLQNLAIRQLKTGEFRVRDGQTLILTGVIEDRVKEVATKWPLLGDIPLIGQLFRSSQSDREKRELVMVITPRIMNDLEGGSYGYGYQPSTQPAKKLIYSP